MAVREDVKLPTFEELTVPEVKLSSVILRAGAFHLGRYCENHFNEFMLCRQEYEPDPRPCIDLGRKVTECTLEFFRMVKSKCSEEFQTYYKCVDRSSSTYSFAYCRKKQAVFDKCMLDNYDIVRPEFGYFCRAKVHRTDRPKPEEEPEVYDEHILAKRLPDDYPRYLAKYGSRKTMREP